MNNKLRKCLIVGNWKMHKTAAEAVELAQSLADKVGQQTDIAIAVCPPFTALHSVAKVLEGSNIALGAQNMHSEASGAFTGEISAQMLRHHFVTYVILGHSERRSLMGETDEWINQKVRAALKSSLRPILCVGETAQERDAQQTLVVLERQILKGLAEVTASHADNLVIAYEPIWSIGTGQAAAPEVAQEAHAFIRSCLDQHFGEDKAVKIRILYGGSVKPELIEGLIEQPDIDGVLVGGASLEAASFIKIVQNCISIEA